MQRFRRRQTRLRQLSEPELFPAAANLADRAETRMSADAAPAPRTEPAPAPPDQDVRRRERALAALAVEPGSALAAALAEHSGNALADPVCGSYGSALLLAVDWQRIVDSPVDKRILLILYIYEYGI
jgi:hypothetical protein